MTTGIAIDEFDTTEEIEQEINRLQDVQEDLSEAWYSADGSRIPYNSEIEGTRPERNVDSCVDEACRKLNEADSMIDDIIDDLQDIKQMMETEVLELPAEVLIDALLHNRDPQRLMRASDSRDSQKVIVVNEDNEAEMRNESQVDEDDEVIEPMELIDGRSLPAKPPCKILEQYGNAVDQDKVYRDFVSGVRETVVDETDDYEIELLN